jgi:hypothetical protein
VSDFFDSPVVRASLAEIQELQEELMQNMMAVGMLRPPTSQQGKEQLDLMRKLIDKQKNFIFRLTLSDDPKANEMKEHIMESARFLGLKPGEDINEFFNNLEKTLDRLEQTLDKGI